MKLRLCLFWHWMRRATATFLAAGFFHACSLLSSTEQQKTKVPKLFSLSFCWHPLQHRWPVTSLFTHLLYCLVHRIEKFQHFWNFLPSQHGVGGSVLTFTPSGVFPDVIELWDGEAGGNIFLSNIGYHLFKLVWSLLGSEFRLIKLTCIALHPTVM